MNKLNTTLLVVIATALFLTILGAQTKQPQSTNQPGRYQLFSAETDELGSKLPARVILRIDTQTGTVDQWMFGERKDGALVDLWGRTGEMRPRPTK
jgi:hypothetical protein